MKKFKKFTSIALAAAMMSAMAFPALAEDTNNATIVINNAVAGKVYSVYKIFTYSTNAAGTGYTYTMDEDTFTVWGEYIDTWKYDTDGDDIGDLDVFDYTARTENNETTYYFTANRAFSGNNSDIVKAFGEHLQDKENKGTAVDSTTVTIDDEGHVTENSNKLTVNGNGYYFIDTQVGSLVNLWNIAAGTDVFPINEKTQLPSVTEKKMVNSKGENIGSFDSNAVGETVYFKVTVNVPEGNDAQVVIHDRMGDGLQLDADSIKLNDNKVSSTENTTTYYYRQGSEQSNACDFEVVLTEEYVKGLTANDRTLTLTYSAKVTSDISGDGITGKNEAWTTYRETTIPGEETKVYAAYFAIKKVIAGTDTLLPGAKFRLYSDATGTTEVYLTHTVGTNEWVVNATGTTGDAIETNDSSNVTIKGLKDGEYWLKEIEAPNGYNLLTDLIPLSIADFDDDESTTDDGKLALWDTETEKFKVTTDNVVKVENSAGTQLPSTGGIGTTVFYAAGIILMAGAVFFVVRRKRA